MEASNVSELSLKELFSSVKVLIDDLESGRSAELGDAAQRARRVENTIVQALRAVQFVNSLQLFSRNDTLDDIATADIKYLLLTAYLGYLYNQQSDMKKRLESLRTSAQFCRDYLLLCRGFSIFTGTIPALADASAAEQSGSAEPSASTSSSSAQTVDAAARRQEKIRRFKLQRERVAHLQQLEEEIEKQAKAGSDDDSLIREYYVEEMRRWCDKACEELALSTDEVRLLEYRASLPDGQQAAQRPARREAPLRPFILVRDEAMRKVYGLGYPSVPTYTVEQWYEHQVQHGLLPVPGAHAPPPPPTPQHDDDRDDDLRLRQQRAWDEWKDDHRRGSGNRQNQG